MPARGAECLAEVRSRRRSSSASEGEDRDDGGEPEKDGGDTWPATPQERRRWEDDRRETALRASRAVRLSYLGGPADGLPEELRTILVEGASEPGDPLHGALPEPAPPPWYDEQLFLEGQRVANLFYAGLAEAELLTLFLVFATPSGMDPLVATGRSDSPEAAGRRYMSTELRLQSWYSSDPFDEASDCRRQLRAVRRLHSHVRRMCSSATPEQLAVKFTIGKDQPRPLTCPMTPVLRGVFGEAADRAGGPASSAELQVDRYRRPFLTQAEMSTTQFGFFGLFILHPHLFAAPYITRRQLEALVHMWAVLGHCLGIRDRYNWCLGGLDVVLKRSELYLSIFAVPNLLRVGAEWEHMLRCMVDGLRSFVPLLNSFEANLAYLTGDVLRLDVPAVLAVRRTLSWWRTLELWQMRLLMQHLPRLWPPFSRWMGAALRWLFAARSRNLKVTAE